MKTSTSLIIAAGAIAAVVGLGTVVSAENGWRGPGFGMHGSGHGGSHDRYRKGGHMGGGSMGAGPMQGMMGQGMMGHSVMKQFFETADADKDGKLTVVEIETARTQRFESHDANGDGKLTLEEFDALFREMTQPVTVRVFQFLDPDGDAVITKEEFDRPTSRIVKFLDRDGDGVLSPKDRHGSRHHSGFRHGRYDMKDGGPKDGSSNEDAPMNGNTDDDN